MAPNLEGGVMKRVVRLVALAVLGLPAAVVGDVLDALHRRRVRRDWNRFGSGRSR